MVLGLLRGWCKTTGSLANVIVSFLISAISCVRLFILTLESLHLLYSPLPALVISIYTLSSYDDRQNLQRRVLVWNSLPVQLRDPDITIWIVRTTDEGISLPFSGDMSTALCDLRYVAPYKNIYLLFTYLLLYY